MDLPPHYIDKIRITAIVIWLTVMLFLITGFHLIKEAIVFILSKLYEFFIQRGLPKQ